MEARLKIVVTTDIPSPYQVQLFDAIVANGLHDIFVVYVRRSASGRQWNPTELRHGYTVLSEDRDLAEKKIAGCDLAVIGTYQAAPARHLMSLRASMQRPWAFWGERPGVRFSGWLGRMLRLFSMRALRRSPAPVWGIGQWAVDGYRSELGERRAYFNVPYYSDLDAFFALERTPTPSRAVRLFFSGVFVRRKGVDILASAFARLIGEGHNVELHLVGSGELEDEIRARCAACADRLFLHGFRQWSELPAMYAKGDVLCAPSLYDGWGLIVVEGLAAGMPVISTDRTGAARELLNPDVGWRIPAGDEDALLDAMRAAVTMPPERRNAMGRAGREVASRQTVQAGVRRFIEAAEASVEAWRIASM